MEKRKAGRNSKKTALPDKNFRGRAAEKWMEALWDELLGKLNLIQSKEKLKRVVERLISAKEKKMILRRLAIEALVRSGKSYRQIGEILWISHPTISTVKKNIFNVGNYKSYRKFYKGPRQYSVDEIKSEKSFLEELFGDVDIWEIIKNPPRPPGTGLKR